MPHDKKDVLIEVGDGIVYPINGGVAVGVVATVIHGDTCNLTVVTPTIGGTTTQYATAKDCEVLVKEGRRIADTVIVGDQP